MMKLRNSRQSEFYENHFHKKGYDTIHCPEYLKKHLNTFFAVEKLHPEEQMRKALV